MRFCLVICMIFLPALVQADCRSAGFPTRFDSIIEKSVRKHWPAEWQHLHCAWRAQLAAESSLSVRTCERANRVGAKCLAQIIPQTAKFISSKIGVTASRSDAKAAIMAGAWYMAYLGREWNAPRPSDGRWVLAVASYNSGLGHQLDAQGLARDNGYVARDWDEFGPKFLPKIVSSASAEENIKYVAKVRALRREMSP